MYPRCLGYKVSERGSQLGNVGRPREASLWPSRYTTLLSVIKGQNGARSWNA